MFGSKLYSKDEDNSIIELLAMDTTLLKGFGYIDLRIMLREAYDQSMETYVPRDVAEEVNPAGARALVAMSWNEDNYTNNLENVRMRDYRVLRIKELYGISLMEYIDLPTAYLKKINADATLVNVEEAAALKKAPSP